ncbi:MAG: PorT family protein [Cyclobacteriaceae bacterium]|nr:PorT family protein [Cyclobacteriaceae bacterium]
MKRIILILLVVSSVSMAYSQVNFSAGLKGGVNFANLQGGNANDVYDNRTGYHAGAFLSFKAQRFGFQPEIIISSQGSKVTTAIINYTDRMDYLNIPVLLKFYPADFLSFQFGPQFGILMKQKRSIGSSADLITVYKESDLSLVVGVGIELPMGLNLEGRYNIGISNVNDDPLIVSEIENQVYQVSVGFRLFEFGDKD